MSNPTTTELAREFLHRYQILSQNSGYNLVYDTLALIRELIPCWSLGMVICRPKTLDYNDVTMDTVPLWLEDQALAATANLFFGVIDGIGFVKKFLYQTMANALSGKIIQVYSFFDHPQHNKGFIHYYYALRNRSDVMIATNLIARNQFINNPHTDSFYGLFCNLAHNSGSVFTQSEKELLALCFDIFCQDIKNKISTPEDSPFLPQITGELICQKTKPQALFDTGNKYSPRQLATIKACFDLKQQKRKISGREVARFLHLNDQETDETTLKNATAKVDHDFGKIRDQLLRDVPTDTDDYRLYKKQFRIEHVTDVFKTYAYFGLYPDTANRYTSYLQRRLKKWR